MSCDAAKQACPETLNVIKLFSYAYLRKIRFDLFHVNGGFISCAITYSENNGLFFYSVASWQLVLQYIPVLF